MSVSRAKSGRLAEGGVGSTAEVSKSQYRRFREVSQILSKFLDHRSVSPSPVLSCNVDTRER